MRRTSCIPLILVCVALSAGCAAQYSKYKFRNDQQQYFKGDPALAERTIAPKAEEAVRKNTLGKNLMVWDLGVYRFAQGNYDGAIEAFMEGVKDVEELHSAGQTVVAAVTSASGQKYVGDPVEVSVAYLYIGLCYYMKGDYQNALVGFRRSLEEDLSLDAARQGDMGITNYMMGETFLQLGKHDDAAVAFRRVLEYAGDIVPARIGLYYALERMGATADLDAIRERLDECMDEAVAENWREHPEQGITVVIFSGTASQVQKDDFLGSFRTRVETKPKAKNWRFTVLPEPGCGSLYFSDSMHKHFTDQGGLGGEVRKQATRAAVSAGLKAIFGFGLDNTDADVRYWPTMPGYVHIGYMPVPPGEYSIEVEGLDSRDRVLGALSRTHDGIRVSQGRRTLVVLTSFGTVSSSVM